MDSSIQLVEVQDTNAMNLKLISTYQKANLVERPSTPKIENNQNHQGNASYTPDYIPLRSPQPNNKPPVSGQNVFSNAPYNPLGSSSNNVNKQQSNSTNNGTPSHQQQNGANNRSVPNPSPKATPKANKRRKIDNNTYQPGANNIGKYIKRFAARSSFSHFLLQMIWTGKLKTRLRRG